MMLCGEPPYGLSPHRDSQDFAMWDAAYVLGALSPAERCEFEAHLGVCASCRAAVAELNDLVPLLKVLDVAEGRAIGEGGTPGRAPPAAD